ncbi:PstS family phosphate ABC transporter substrate-binding protein [Albibacterium bauzanense]|uniref:Phosphate ABC transporter substrate-binding protein (PhoT family) n=1 Tax=Albibacterium bauzanense TaxID=653929 RepID=A0A4V2PXP1_9SPHI|nr:substrate-binding domain-containing protein [Albibacterium bauzanense]TCK82841.1 phosphate ABC transporter substrate-binding protein (PhoT family) [Albibacterium bauzanense]
MDFIKKNAYLFLTLVVSSLIISCTSTPPTKETHTIVTGIVSIVVDETFQPIVEDQLTVFENTYLEADITLVNRPEKLAINYLMNDSAKIAILSRTLTKEEMQFFEAKKIVPKITRFATDGIALITSKGNQDSVVTVDDIINILQGKPSTISTLVFDNPNSSTVRFLKELAAITDFPKERIYALNSNADIIKYVYNNPHAVGVVGINWMAQPDADLLEYTKGLKVLGVKNQRGKDGDDAFYKPSQNNLALGKYALARDLYVINCQGVMGLGVGFSAFLAGERGQRIILKSGLLPDSIPPREINIRNQINLN